MSKNENPDVVPSHGYTVDNTREYMPAKSEAPAPTQESAPAAESSPAPAGSTAKEEKVTTPEAGVETPAAGVNVPGGEEKKAGGISVGNSQGVLKIRKRKLKTEIK